MNFLERKKLAFLTIKSNSGVLPPGYTQLNYIESTGTQYIDTGFIPTGLTKVVLDVLYTNTVSQRLFGSYSTATSNAFVISSASGNFYCSYGTAPYAATRAIVAGQRYEIGFGYNLIGAENVRFMVDNSTLRTFAVTNINSGINAILLGTNYGGTIGETSNFKGYMYSCKLYDNDNLVRDFIPCINPNNDVGAYDIVNGVFYGNVGTGDFIAGQPV